MLSCGRNIICHPGFRLFLSSSQRKRHFNPAITANSTLLNYSINHDTFIEDLISRTFARVRPELHEERLMALNVRHQLLDAVIKCSGVLGTRLLVTRDKIQDVVCISGFSEFFTRTSMTRLKVSLLSSGVGIL